MGQQGGRVGVAAVGFGSEIGGVGFDQHFIAGELAGDVAEFKGLFESEDTAEGDVAAQVYRLVGHGGAAGEAVEDEGGACVFLQDGEGVGFGVAGVDDHGEACLFGGGEVGVEALDLFGFFGMVIEIVEAGFAHGDDFGVLQVREEFGCGYHPPFPCVVGVDAEDDADVGLLFGESEGRLPFVAFARDIQAMGDARELGLMEASLGGFGAVFFVEEVAVGIDHGNRVLGC